MNNKDDWYTAAELKAYGHQQKARAFIKKKKFHEAIKELQKASRCDPFCPNHFCNLGFYYRETGQIKESIACYKRCVELIDDIINTTGQKKKTQREIKDYSIMLASAGGVMNDMGDPDGKRCLETALRLNPNNWVVRYNVGLCYLKNNFMEDAIREFTAAFKFNKHNPDLITDLAYSYNSVGMIEESIGLIEGYRKDHPLTNRMLNILGASYACFDTTMSDAIKCFQQMVVNEPNESFPHALLAYAYADLGWKNEAYGEIDRAKALNKEEQDKDTEELIKDVLKILEDPGDDKNTRLFLFLLMLMKKKMYDKKYKKDNF